MRMSVIASLVTVLDVLGALNSVAASAMRRTFPPSGYGMVAMSSLESSKPESTQSLANREELISRPIRSSSTTVPDLPQITSGPCVGDGCTNIVQALNICRGEERNNRTNPLCGCEHLGDLVACASCFASSSANSPNISDIATSLQQQINNFVGLCNKAISNNATSSNSIGDDGAPPFSTPLSSASLSFSPGVNTSAIIISATPFEDSSTTTAPGAPENTGGTNPIETSSSLNLTSSALVVGVGFGRDAVGMGRGSKSMLFLLLGAGVLPSLMVMNVF